MGKAAGFPVLFPMVHGKKRWKQHETTLNFEYVLELIHCDKYGNNYLVNLWVDPSTFRWGRHQLVSTQLINPLNVYMFNPSSSKAQPFSTPLPRLGLQFGYPIPLLLHPMVRRCKPL
jgi:hypothetical protein